MSWIKHMQEACTPSILLNMTCMLIFCLNIDFVFSLSHTQTLLNLNSHCIGPNHLRYCTIISHLGHLQRLFNPNDKCLYQNILMPPHIACYSVFPHLFIRLKCQYIIRFKYSSQQWVHFKNMDCGWTFTPTPHSHSITRYLDSRYYQSTPILNIFKNRASTESLGIESAKALERVQIFFTFQPKVATHHEIVSGSNPAVWESIS